MTTWRIQRMASRAPSIALVEEDGYGSTAQHIWIEDWQTLRLLAEQIILATDRPEPAGDILIRFEVQP